mgnify:CR=1 FL=1
MPTEEELFAQRLDKRARLRAAGDPYPARLDRTLAPVKVAPDRLRPDSSQRLHDPPSDTERATSRSCIDISTPAKAGEAASASPSVSRANVGRTRIC